MASGEFEFLRSFVSIRARGLEQTVKQIETRLLPLLAKLKKPIEIKVNVGNLEKLTNSLKSLRTETINNITRRLNALATAAEKFGTAMQKSSAQAQASLQAVEKRSVRSGQTVKAFFKSLITLGKGVGSKRTALGIFSDPSAMQSFDRAFKDRQERIRKTLEGGSFSGAFTRTGAAIAGVSARASLALTTGIGGAVAKITKGVALMSVSFLRAGVSIAQGFIRRVQSGLRSILSFQRRLRFELLLAVNILGEEFRELALATSPALLLGDTVNKIAIFDDAVTKTASALKIFRAVVPAAFKAVEDGVRNISVGSRFVPDEVAEATFAFAQAGFNVQQSLGATEKAIELAQAGFVEIGEAANISAAALKEFGVDTTGLEDTKAALDDLNDVLVEAQLIGLSTVQELGKTFGKGGPLAQAANISIVEFATLATALSQIGVIGEEAGTAIRTSLQRLAKQPKDVQKGLANLNIDLKKFTDATGKFKKGGILDLFVAMKEAGATVKDLSLIFGAKAGSLSGVVKFADDLDTIAAKLEKAKRDNIAAKISEANAASVQGFVQIARAAFVNLQIEVGKVLGPGLKRASKAIFEFSNSMTAALKTEKVKALVDLVLSSVSKTVSQIAPVVNEFLKIATIVSSAMAGAFRGLVDLISEVLTKTLGLREAMVNVAGVTDTWASTIKAAVLLLSDGEAAIKSILFLLKGFGGVFAGLQIKLATFLKDIAPSLANVIGRAIESAVLTALQSALRALQDTKIGKAIGAKEGADALRARSDPKFGAEFALEEAARRANERRAFEEVEALFRGKSFINLRQRAARLKELINEELAKVDIAKAGQSPLEQALGNLAEAAKKSFVQNFQAEDIFEPFRNALKSVGAEVASIWAGIKKDVDLKESINEQKVALRNFIDGSIPLFEKLGKKIKDSLATPAQEAEALSRARAQVKSKVEGRTNFLKNLGVDPTTDPQRLRIDDIVNQISQRFEAELSKIKKRGGFGGLTRLFEDIPETAKNKLDFLADAIANMGLVSADTAGSVKEFINSTIDSALGFFGRKKKPGESGAAADLSEARTFDLQELVNRLTTAGSKKIEEDMLAAAEEGVAATKDVKGAVDGLTETIKTRTFETVLA